MTILLPGFIGEASGANSGTALLLQVTPAEGGSLNISPGVHMYDRDAEVTLSASPKPGYQFVCWQGRVKEAASSSTLVFLDSPKIVIAVFERSKFDLMEMAEEEAQVSGGRGGLYRSAGDIAAPLEQAIGGRRPHKWRWPKRPPDEDEIDDVPVPDDQGQSDVPVPSVPEPATVTLLFLGMAMLAKHRNRRTGEKHKTL
ncbi:MAG: PEP-CTERM sorting domain-containing protein [Sedimentisphaerales bacterium]|nr:PEP-CTERM sorting domain-containing protein [Sedimentisphaerales bacterium]